MVVVRSSHTGPLSESSTSLLGLFGLDIRSHGPIIAVYRRLGSAMRVSEPTSET